MGKLNKVFAKSRPNIYKSKFKVVDGEFLSTMYKGQKFLYKIISIEPNGIYVLDESDNGAEIKNLISWNRIK